MWGGGLWWTQTKHLVKTSQSSLIYPTLYFFTLIWRPFWLFTVYLLQATLFYLDNNMIKILHTAFKALTLLLHPVSSIFNPLPPPQLILQTAVMVIIWKHSFLLCDSHNKNAKISLYFSVFLCFIHTSFLTSPFTRSYT